MKQLGLFDKLPARDPAELREKFPNLNTAWRPNPNPQKIPDRWRNQLEPMELEWAKHMGHLDEDYANERDYKTTLGASEKDDPREKRQASHIQGKRGELHLGKACDLAIPADWRKRIGRPDFGPFDGPGLVVRCSSANDASLIVRPRDPDNSVAVLVTEFTPGDARVHAYCWVADAKHETPLTNPRVMLANGKRDVDKPAHFVRMAIEIDGRRVPNPIVHILDDHVGLPEEILKLCPKGYKSWSVR